MNKKSILTYLVATCTLAIVLPGRFAIGLAIAIEVFFISFFSCLFRNLLEKINVKEIVSILMGLFTVSLTILYKQLLILICPELALQLSFLIYLPAIATFVSLFLNNEKKETLKQDLLAVLPPVLIYMIFIIVFSLIRDILGFGTITLISIGKLKEIVLFNSDYVRSGTFLATIPGAIFLCAIFLLTYIAIDKKVSNNKNKEEAK